MEITDKMVYAADAAYWENEPETHSFRAMRFALEAALEAARSEPAVPQGESA